VEGGSGLPQARIVLRVHGSTAPLLILIILESRGLPTAHTTSSELIELLGDDVMRANN